MKRIGILAVAALVFGIVGAVPSHAGPINLITNGTFNTPSPLNGGWSLYSNGQINGWTTTDPSGIEIDTAGPIGPGTNPFSTNSLEVNANNPETVQQTLTGLTVGQEYTLNYEYGDRPGSGPESMEVAVGGTVLGTDTDLGGNSVLVWTGNSYKFVATSSTENLDFIGLSDTGQPSYGNEVDAVTLYATPEPSTWLLMISGLALLGFAVSRKRSVSASLPTATI
jgi:hypothetical protein